MIKEMFRDEGVAESALDVVKGVFWLVILFVTINCV